MKRFRSIPKTWMVIFTSLVTALTILAALHLREPSSTRFEAQRDPLAPGLDAPDVTGEKAEADTRPVDMDRIDEMARAKLGPMPKLISPEQRDARDRPQGPGAQALEQARRIRQIRKTQGTAAALAALKSQHPLAAP